MDQSPEDVSSGETDIPTVPHLENTAKFISSTLSKLSYLRICFSAACKNSLEKLQSLPLGRFTLVTIVEQCATQIGITFMKVQNGTLGRLKNLARQNIKLARRLDGMGGRSPSALDQLRDLTLNFGFSLATGELLHLNGGWYVTHAALLRLASRKHCAGIKVEQVDQSSDPLAGRWVFKATVFKSPSSLGFVGYGDADPSNVSSLVRGAEMRVAETRAVNRALRRAVFVLGKIDEILAWDKGRLHERDLRFVDLGRYLCEVRAGQYWRLEKMKSREWP
jgi:hypothetical protein